MTRYIPIPPDRVPAANGRQLWTCDDRSIALFNVDGTLYALDDACPHAGSSLINGTIQGRTVQCRAHGLRFDLLTGCMQNVRTFGARAYGIEVRAGQPHLVMHETGGDAT